MAVVLESLANLAVLIFVLTSMLSMGLRLTVSEILEPLRNQTLVAKALAANFVLVPVLGYLIVTVVPLTEGQAIGVILLATAAGAPFLPKLVEVAKGDIAFGVGLMVLLMVLTIVYVPIILPVLLPGVQVNPFDIASSLVVLMLIPLAIGLFVKARYADIAAWGRPIMAQTSNVSVILLTVLMLVLNFDNLVSVIGTGVIVAILAFVVGSLLIGYLLGGPATETKSVMGLGTAQRNIAAGFVVALQNFQDPDLITILLVGSVLMFVILLAVSGELRRRSNVPEERGEMPSEGGEPRGGSDV